MNPTVKKVRLFFKKIIPRGMQPTEIYTRQLMDHSQMKVVVGPFKGLRYVERAVGSTVQPKLLGIYERELWECVEQAAKIPFETIIDIGAAEGYYSIGMAMRIPAAKNIAFEMNPAGREL